MSETAQPVFSIEKLYVKDLSIEVPNAPQIFLERENPAALAAMRARFRALHAAGLWASRRNSILAGLGEREQA